MSSALARRSLLDPTMPHDSSLTVELLARAIETARVQCAALGHPFPKEVLVWVAGNYHNHRTPTLGVCFGECNKTNFPCSL